jgi:hypothetical protein
MNRVKPNIIVRPFGVQRQAIVSFGETHMIIGSPLIHDTISSANQPLDLLVATLATDCTFAGQEAARLLEIPLVNLTTSAQWIEGDPAVEEVRMAMKGPTQEQVDLIIKAVQANSVIYRLFEPVLRIELRPVC